jgi:hypothetical protein
MSIKMVKVQKVQIGTSTHLYQMGIRYKGTHTLWCVPYVPGCLCIDKKANHHQNILYRRASEEI